MNYILDYQHYGIFCTDVEEASTIYQNAFGFKEKSMVEIGEGEGYWKIAILELGQVTLELLQHGDLSKIRPSAAADQNHIAFRVSNLEQLITHLLKEFDVFTMEDGGYVIGVQGKTPIFSSAPNGFTGEHEYADMKWQYMRGPNCERIELVEVIK